MANANTGESTGRFFANESNRVIYVLPEEGGDPVRVGEHSRFEGGIDAWMDPAVARLNENALVFKVVDGISVLYTDDFKIRLEGGSWYERIGQRTEGGWKDRKWLDGIPYFRDFYETAMDDAQINSALRWALASDEI